MSIIRKSHEYVENCVSSFFSRPHYNYLFAYLDEVDNGLLCKQILIF